MRRRRLRLSDYSLLKESQGSITGATTVSELLAQGLIKQSQVDAWNARAGRLQQRASTQATKGSNLEIARVAIAYFLVNNYGLIPDGEELHNVRSQRDDKKRKIGFGKKPCEIIVGKVFDAMGIAYNTKVGASGSAREYTDKVFQELQSQGILTNNRSEVSNNAHVRYGKTSDPSLPDEFPENFPQGDQFPTLKESVRTWLKYLHENVYADVAAGNPASDDSFVFDDSFDFDEEFSSIFYISAPDELKFIADQCDQEICNIVDQFTEFAIRQDN